MTKHQQATNSSSSTNSTTEHTEHSEHNHAATALQKLGGSVEGVEKFIQNAPYYISDAFHELHHMPGVKHSLAGVGGVAKILDVYEFSDTHQELRELGYSKTASIGGASATVGASTSSAIIGADAVCTGGAVLIDAALLGAAVTAPQLLIAAGGVAMGSYLILNAHQAGEAAKHATPIIIDATLDQFKSVYDSASQFVSNAVEFCLGNKECEAQVYQDIESAMLQFGYLNHVRQYQLNLEQQLIYSTITRDLFREQFKLNPEKKLSMNAKVPMSNDKKPVDPKELKKDLNQLKDKIVKENEKYEKNGTGRIKDLLQEQNKKLDKTLNTLVGEANKKSRGSAPSAPIVKSNIQQAYEFSEAYNACAQGIALIAHIGGNHRLANQVAGSAIGVSQIAMGLAQIAQGGMAIGPVGMVLGGVNCLINIFGQEDNKMWQEFAEQLAMISKQIHALHEDMLLQFSRVFTALGVINTNILEGFKELHKHQRTIAVDVQQLRKAVFTLQDSLNVIGKKIDGLGAEINGYELEGDRKQLQVVINEIKAKIKYDFDRVDLLTKLIAAFKTFNEEVVIRKVSAGQVSLSEISRNLTTKLGSAEANTGLLLNFAKNYLGIDVQLPIADPEQWRQCANLLMEMIERKAEQKQSLAVMGKNDYVQFEYFKAIGDNWLQVIADFKQNKNGSNQLTKFFNQYRNTVKRLNALIAEFVANQENSNKIKGMPEFQGFNELKKQAGFKFEFKRNNAFISIMENGNSNFHNGQHQHRDDYVGEWNAHVELRQKEIDAHIENYKNLLAKKAEVFSGNRDYELFPENPRSYPSMFSASVFLKHAQTPDTMPLLPFPINFKGFNSDLALYLQAEKLRLGVIEHLYQYVNNHFVYTIQFVHDPKQKPMLIKQFQMPCKLADHLNPAEAAWHAYMGGTYPSSAATSRKHRRNYSTHDGGYWEIWSCDEPTIKTFPGIRETLRESNVVKVITDADLQKVTQLVLQKQRELRAELNKTVTQQLESVDSRNPIANALLEVDAAAKILIAFMSIVFRKEFQLPAGVWTRDQIMNYVNTYNNHATYLHQQLLTNLDVIQAAENILQQQMASQSKSAYTPLNDTLTKLSSFMKKYEEHVQDDQDLAAEERIANSKDAVMYGAAQAALLVQGELLRAGHIDAATHLSTLFSQVGLNLLTAQPENTRTLQLARTNFFNTASVATNVLPIQSAPVPRMGSNNDDDGE